MKKKTSHIRHVSKTGQAEPVFKYMTVIVQIPIEKCSKCGGTDIETFNCGYSSFNVCGITCKCGRTIKRTGDYAKEELIKLWNSINGRITPTRKLEILREQLKRHNIEPEV